ncbi:hypothetical protein K2X89_12095 [Myxococcota bacterium]|nr:hypothetical protein [Myxococcota bacterium]
MTGFTRASLGLALLMLSIASLAGCATERVLLNAEPIAIAEASDPGSAIGLSRGAEGVPDTVGRPTFTLFAIPVGRVRLDRGPERIMEGLGKALEAADYRPVPAEERPELPALICKVTHFKFKTYTWFMPLTLLWGEIKLEISLVGPEGRVLWKNEYSGDYDGKGVGESFDKAMNSAFSKIVTHASEDFSKDSFRAACCGPVPD